MRWTVNSERTLYRDNWVHLSTADVVLPDGRHLDHRMIHTADGAYLAMVHRHRVLLLWRHRFITDTWGWEVPGGSVDPNEAPVHAAAREAEEETGWRPDPPLRLLANTRPMAGLFGTQHHVYRADSATYLGPPVDGWESERIAWIPIDDVPGLIDRGEVVEGTTLVALLCLLRR